MSGANGASSGRAPTQPQSRNYSLIEPLEVMIGFLDEAVDGKCAIAHVILDRKKSHSRYV